MPSIYKNEDEKCRDILLANVNPDLSFKFAETPEGCLRAQELNSLEKQILREDRVEAIANLAIDKAMQF